MNVKRVKLNRMNGTHVAFYLKSRNRILIQAERNIANTSSYGGKYGGEQQKKTFKNCSIVKINNIAINKVVLSVFKIRTGELVIIRVII